MMGFFLALHSTVCRQAGLAKEIKAWFLIAPACWCSTNVQLTIAEFIARRITTTNITAGQHHALFHLNFAQ
jgi:hypothetical protein